MFGFVEADKGELKVREFELYRAYYCGICKSISSRYNRPASAILSYDAVFLAILLASLLDDEEDIQVEPCIFHPISKRSVVKNNDAVDYAADMLIMLSYHKALDDRDDDHKIRGSLGKVFLQGFYDRVSEKYPLTCEKVEKALGDLDRLEEEQSPSIDLTSAASGRMLGAVFAGYLIEGPGLKSSPRQDDQDMQEKTSFYFDPQSVDENRTTARILEQTGFDLGRWVYLADAAFDLEEDKEKGSYNPLIYRDGGAENILPVLTSYVQDVNADLALLDINKNNSIIENISGDGLYAKIEEIRQLYQAEEDKEVEDTETEDKTAKDK